MKMAPAHFAALFALIGCAHLLLALFMDTNRYEIILHTFVATTFLICAAKRYVERNHKIRP